MAWRCSADTLYSMVHNLKDAGIITKPRIEHVMKLVDRKNYCHTKENAAYNDNPLPIGSNATISAPHMHAYALEYLEPFLTEGARVLDIGAGSGYLCACFGRLVGKTGHVIGVEHIPDLVKQCVNNISKEDQDLLGANIVEVIVGDGRFGAPEHGKFDVIHVGAYIRDIPQPLIDQLNPGGRMFIPAGTPPQVILVDKDNFGNVFKKGEIQVSYVPLTSKEAQLAE